MDRYVLELTIPFLPLTFNKAKRKHHHEFNQINKSWYEIIHLYSRGKTPLKPLEKVRLTLCRFGHQYCDYDGLVASFKAPVDGLERNNIISKDSWKVTGKWRVDQVRVKKTESPYISIKVEEIFKEESHDV